MAEVSLDTVVERIDNLKSWMNNFNRDMNNKFDRLIQSRDDQYKEHNKEHLSIWSELTALKVKSTVWGAIGGAVTVATAILIMFASRLL